MDNVYYNYKGEIIEANSLTGFNGQYLQDEYVYEHFFEGYRDGTFVDIGAHDGVSLSNTFFFEKKMSWKGLCIEPNPDVFNYLQKNRNNCLQIALSDKEETVEYTKIKGYAQTLSGITEYYHEKYPERIEEEINFFGGSKEIIQIKTKTLNSVLEEHGYGVIDFMSLDTEGSELKILRGLDFNRFKVRVIAMENNFDSEVHREFMKERGYILKTRIKIDDIYYKV
jgi:FkbM family methyltransferase